MKKLGKLLTDEQCFLKYIEYGGTLGQAGKWAEIENIVSPNTGYIVNRNTIFVKTMMYIVRHPEESRQKLAEIGIVYSDNDWNEWLIRKALRYAGGSKGRFLNWLKKNKLRDRKEYEHIYAKRMGLL